MLYSNTDEAINSMMNTLNTPKRKSKGRDTTKNYHKITISINEKDKREIIEYAEKQGVSVSQLIKDLVLSKVNKEK